METSCYCAQSKQPALLANIGGMSKKQPARRTGCAVQGPRLCLHDLHRLHNVRWISENITFGPVDSQSSERFTGCLVTAFCEAAVVSTIPYNVMSSMKDSHCGATSTQFVLNAYLGCSKRSVLGGAYTPGIFVDVS
jgi:hypothetical protein